VLSFHEVRLRDCAISFESLLRAVFCPSPTALAAAAAEATACQDHASTSIQLHELAGDLSDLLYLHYVMIIRDPDPDPLDLDRSFNSIGLPSPSP
jgi:hypothetical protein